MRRGQALRVGGRTGPQKLTVELALLFLVGAGAAFVALLGSIVLGAFQPRRATTGWALARGLSPTPSEAGWAFAEHRLAMADGAVIPAWVVELEGGAGTLVLLHGFGRSRIDSLRRLFPYRQRLRRAVLLDLRGHGESTGSGTHLGTDDHLDVIEALRQLHLLDDPSHQPLVLAGHSMGAAVVIRVADELQRRGHGGAGIVLYAPYRRLREPLAGRLHTSGLPLPWLGALAENCLGFLLPRAEALETTAARLNQRALVIAGEDDRMLCVEIAQSITAALPNAELVVEPAAHSDVGTVRDGAADAAISLLLRSVRSGS